MRFVLAVLFILVLSGCLKDGETKTTKCVSDLRLKELNTAYTLTDYSFMDKMAIRVRLSDRLLVKSVMLRGTLPANGGINVDFYLNSYLDNPDTGTHVGTSGANRNASSSTAEEHWFDLLTPIQLEANSDLNYGIEMVVSFGSGTYSLDVGPSNGSLMRYEFRKGSAGGSWQISDYSKMISLGLAGDAGCD